ncbi:MAG: molybdenum cofactor guanylyltransferase [Firmicutes bacterium]|nr:molybdenum cofactor guanylyltransferase [Bacillota bacterium]NSW92548.1 molybdenum cofactor guanylyltransferase [Bacillota bacterium]
MELLGTAIVLAGGKSSRMGFDKAFLDIRGRSMVEIIVDQLRTVFADIIVVTNNPGSFVGLDARISTDILKNAGPLGGIHAGLKLSCSKYAFLAACDMPILSLEYAKYMMEVASIHLPDAVISSKGSWIEPFHALYSKNLADDIEEKVKEGVYKIYDVLKHKNIVKINESKVREYSPDLNIFTNLNDLNDLQEFYKLIETGGDNGGIF